MKNRRVTIWVDPDFRKALRKKALDEDYPDLVSFTKELAKNIDGIKCKKNEKNRFF